MYENYINFFNFTYVYDFIFFFVKMINELKISKQLNIILISDFSPFYGLVTTLHAYFFGPQLNIVAYLSYENMFSHAMVITLPFILCTDFSRNRHRYS